MEGDTAKGKMGTNGTKIMKLLHEALCKNYCMQLFTMYQIEHLKLLFPKKVICVCLFPCLLLSEVFVPSSISL